MVDSQMGAGKTRGELEEIRAAHHWLMTFCDAVTVSTGDLGDLVYHLRGGADGTYIIENAIDAEAFTDGVAHFPHRSEGEIVIGWAGGQRRQTDLVPMLKAWGKIAERHEFVTFSMAGWMPEDYFSYVPEGRTVLWNWTLPGKHGRGMQVDIGCCPVPRTRFDQNKSPIKAYEFALAGAAVIGSSIPYGSVLEPWGIQGTVCGYMADTADEWEDAIEAYIQNPQMRRKHAERLRYVVDHQHTLHTQARKWARTYRTIAGMESQDDDVQGETTLQRGDRSADDNAGMRA
jgi:glycosyltransferase involved in cell wall biosynthesis